VIPEVVDWLIKFFNNWLIGFKKMTNITGSGESVLEKFREVSRRYQPVFKAKINCIRYKKK